MLKDWTRIAEAMGVSPPESTAALDALESVFRPLVSALPFETEPAYTIAVNQAD